MSIQSIYSILINLLVLCLVWGTVLAGLILVVRDTVEGDDLALFADAVPPSQNKGRE